MDDDTEEPGGDGEAAGKRAMNIYVASSWRNDFQQRVVEVLRADGHDVYNFKDANSFHWAEVDPLWERWSPADYIAGLLHQCAERGFNSDMEALARCDACVYVMPCGVSASLEAGWACGAGKRVFVYVPELREADLMVKMTELVTSDLSLIRSALLTAPNDKEHDA